MRRGVTLGALGAFGATVAALGAGPIAVLTAATAGADDETVLHNVTYRARIDGLARGALISYRISDTQVSSADPTMLPGRTFETTAVLSDPKEAGMRISIQWPYSANLVCEILVDDQTVAAASEFIGPRLTPARNDPDYGAMTCGAPLSNATGIPMPGPGDADPAVPDQMAAVPLPGTAVAPGTPPLN